MWDDRNWYERIHLKCLYRFVILLLNGYSIIFSPSFRIFYLKLLCIFRMKKTKHKNVLFSHEIKKKKIISFCKWIFLLILMLSFSKLHENVSSSIFLCHEHVALCILLKVCEIKTPKMLLVFLFYVISLFYLGSN